MLSRRIVDPTSKKAFFSKISLLALVAVIASSLSLPIIGNSTAITAVTAPGAQSLLQNSANQAVGDFVISGFTGQDLLVTVALNNPGAGTNFTIVVTEGLDRSHGYGSWNNITEISFVASSTGGDAQDRANAALASITVTTGASETMVDFSVSVIPSIAGVAYNPVNQHFYKAVSSPTLTWDAAKAAAEASTYDGVSGYLATITSEQENNFVTSRILGATNIWIGAADTVTEGTWRWETGPEAGTVFYVTGTGTVSGQFAAWANLEPNNGGGTQDYALTNYGGPTGKWDDQDNTATNGYLIEYSETETSTFVSRRSASVQLTTSVSAISSPNRFDLSANSTDQAVGNFVLSNFPTGDLLISIGLVDPPTGTTFRIATTEGLTRSFGYDSWSGLTEISFVASNTGGNAQARANAALASILVSTGDFGGELNMKVSAIRKEPGVEFNPVNQHFYKYEAQSPVSWTVARALASTKTFEGVEGYLVTITSAQENDFVSKNIPNATSIWIAATDRLSEGVWRWEAGPEGLEDDGKGRIFWKASCVDTEAGCGASTYPATGTTVSGENYSGYQSWALDNAGVQGEPNNSSGEDFAVTNWNGKVGNWNDLKDQPSTAASGYVVEFSEWKGASYSSLRRASLTTTILEPVAPTPDSGTGGGSSPTPAPSVSPSPTPTPGSGSTAPNTSPTRPLPTQSPTPAPAPLAGPAPVPQTGQPSGGTIGGQVVEPQIQAPSTSQLDVKLGDSEVKFNVDPSAGGVTDKDGKPELGVKRDESVNLAGGGMLPGSTIQVWLPNSSGSKELGRISVGPDGTYDGQIAFTAGPNERPLPIGPNVVQVTGVNEEGEQVVLNLTINIAQPTPAPELLLGTTQTPAPGFGNFLATNGGSTEQAVLTALPSDNSALVAGDGWNISLSLTGESSSVREEGGSVFMTLTKGEGAEFAGDGFMPGTIATIWLFSDPLKIGEVTINADGSFSSQTDVIGETVATGEHTIQIQGVGSDGFIRAANLGVVIADPVVAIAAAPVAFMDWFPLILMGLLLLVGLAAWLLTRRRRRSRRDGSNVIQFPQAA